MKSTLKNITLIIGLFILMNGLSSCGTYLSQSNNMQNARHGEVTPMASELKKLPKTSKLVVVAVYKFRDQTGQYKPSENGASWSTAVTQGATTILMKALEDSNWFIPLERENVSNLLNERKILRSSKSQKDGRKDKPLAPLYYAGIILEGGIISYDSNVLTGGVGARYFGAGGSKQYRQDRITIYLRAVSTKTGEVLKTVYTSKTILSQKVDVGLFRFVSFQKLLEAETGYTYNEPVELAVTEAIEKAVYNLVMEGLIEQFWRADDIRDVENDRRIVQYKADRTKFESIDLLGREHQEFRSDFWVQGQLVGARLKGDLRNPIIRPGFELGVGSRLGKKIGWNVNLGFNQMSAQKHFDANFFFSNFSLRYQMLPHNKLNPSLDVGMGVFLNPDAQTKNMTAHFGANLEYIFMKKMGVTFGLQYHHLFNDKIDYVENGSYNDYLLKGIVGLNFYF